MRKNIKNYTSEAKVENTIARIEELVVKKMNARQFFKEYKNGEVIGVVFVIPTDKGDLPFKMPARIEKLEQLFYSQKKPRYSWQKPDPLTVAEREQAKRTAWKNIHDWIDAQIALIETDQVKIEEVFLPYMTNISGQTLFEIMEGSGFKMPQLSAGKAEEGEVVE